MQVTPTLSRMVTFPMMNNYNPWLNFTVQPPTYPFQNFYWPMLPLPNQWTSMLLTNPDPNPEPDPLTDNFP
jgi:hypothetical protein